MPNLRVGYLNRADAATLSASVAATSNITYLQNDSRDDIVQAAAAGAAAIQGNWAGTAYTIGELALNRTNLAFNDSVVLQLWANANYTTLLQTVTLSSAYASGLYDDWGFANINMFFTPVANVKSFTITPTCAAAPFQCSRLFLGPYTEATFNPNYGVALGIATNDITKRTEGGSSSSIVKQYWRTMQFDMLMYTEADRKVWLEIGRYLRTVKSGVFSLYPGVGDSSERDHNMFGKFDKDVTGKITGPNIYDFSLSISEI